MPEGKRCGLAIWTPVGSLQGLVRLASIQLQRPRQCGTRSATAGSQRGLRAVRRLGCVPPVVDVDVHIAGGSHTRFDQRVALRDHERASRVAAEVVPRLQRTIARSAHCTAHARPGQRGGRPYVEPHRRRATDAVVERCHTGDGSEQEQQQHRGHHGQRVFKPAATHGGRRGRPPPQRTFST